MEQALAQSGRQGYVAGPAWQRNAEPPVEPVPRSAHRSASHSRGVDHDGSRSLPGAPSGGESEGPAEGRGDPDAVFASGDLGCRVLGRSSPARPVISLIGSRVAVVPGHLCWWLQIRHFGNERGAATARAIWSGDLRERTQVPLHGPLGIYLRTLRARDASAADVVVARRVPMERALQGRRGRRGR